MLKMIDKSIFSEHSNEILECILELKRGNVKESKKIFNNMKKFIDDNSAIVIANLEKDKINGFIWGYFINESTIHINYFVILNQFRNKGIGKNLLNNMISTFKKVQFELLVFKDNYNAIKLYENFGFLKEEYNNDKYKMVLES